MGNTKLKTDEEWSQEDLGDELFDVYEEDVEGVEDTSALEAVDIDESVAAESPATVEPPSAVQEAKINIEPSSELLSLDFESEPSSELESTEEPDVSQSLELESENSSFEFSTGSRGDRTTQLELSGDFAFDAPEELAKPAFDGVMEYSSVELISDKDRLDINDALPEKELGEVVKDGSMDFSDEDSFGGASEESSEGSFDFSESSKSDSDFSAIEESEDVGGEDEESQFEESSYDELSETASDRSIEATNVLGDVAAAAGSEAVAEPSIQDSNYDWRKFVGMRSAPQGTPKELRSKAFANDLEKHIGLQVVSLLSGERADLHNWKYAVWRDGSLRTYSHDGRSRVTDKMTEEILKTDLRSAVFSLAPLLIQMHGEHFDFVEYMKSKKMAPKKIQSLRKPLTWGGPELSMFGFHAYASRLEGRNYQVFQFDGLGETIFYDGRSRSVYIDLNYYLTKPTSWLLYGVLTKIWALRMGYLPFTSLNVMNEMLPTIEKVKRELSGKKSWLTMKKSPVTKFLKSQYGKKVELHANHIQAIQTDQMFAITNAMNLHIHKLLLADGLDLVGLLSYILKVDVAAHADGLSVMQTQQNNYEVTALFEFAASLSFLS